MAVVGIPKQLIQNVRDDERLPLSCATNWHSLHSLEGIFEKDEPYDEERWSEAARMQDNRLERIKEFLAMRPDKNKSLASEHMTVERA